MVALPRDRDRTVRWSSLGTSHTRQLRGVDREAEWETQVIRTITVRAGDRPWAEAARARGPSAPSDYSRLVWPLRGLQTVISRTVIGSDGKVENLPQFLWPVEGLSPSVRPRTSARLLLTSVT